MEGEDIIEIKKKLLEEPLSKPNERVPGRLIPKDLEAVCMKALKRKRKERYKTANDLLLDLQRYRHGEEVSVYWYSGWEKLVRWNHRKAYWLIAIASGFAGAAIYALLSS